jgi:mannose-6-phosphate isomerase-like protein (cupin superfamily)
MEDHRSGRTRKGIMSNLENKIAVEILPREGNDNAERVIFSPKGEMAQILNRKDETFRHLVYWDLDSARTGQERGHHYHNRKVEHFYVLSGEVELFANDLETSENKTCVMTKGTRATIQPGVAHAFRSTVYSQVLEYTEGPYDPSDTHPYKIAP